MLLALATWCASAHAQEEPAPSEELVITAARAEQARKDVTVATEVIGREEIEASGARTMDELLRAAPGIEVTPTFGGSGVRMQGLDPKHVLVLVDGRPVDGRVDGTVDLARLRVSDIERVEVVKGPSSALYGSDALGGVINIVTRSSDAPWQADGAARYGTWRTADASAVVGGGGGDWRPLRASCAARRSTARSRASPRRSPPPRCGRTSRRSRSRRRPVRASVRRLIAAGRVEPTCEAARSPLQTYRMTPAETARRR